MLTCWKSLLLPDLKHWPEIGPNIRKNRGFIIILDSSLSNKFTGGYIMMPINTETQRHLDELPASDLYGCERRAEYKTALVGHPLSLRLSRPMLVRYKKERPDCKDR